MSLASKSDGNCCHGEYADSCAACKIACCEATTNESTWAGKLFMIRKVQVHGLPSHFDMAFCC